MKCGMSRQIPEGTYGKFEGHACTKLAVGTTSDGTLVCDLHARQLEDEGEEVDRDSDLEDDLQELRF